ncbi:MAG: SigE family RNA polymerase sigma factor [Actinomycetota bacterium]
MDQDEHHQLRIAFEAHYQGLVGLCVLLTGRPAEAEDLAQEAFVRAATHVRNIEPDRLAAYLRSSAINAWRNRLRSEGTWRRYLPRVAPSSGQVDPSGGVDDRDMIWRALSTLPARQRACLVLRYYEGLSEAEIADVLGCTPGTVKSQTHKALKNLRKEVQPDG